MLRFSFHKQYQLVLIYAYHTYHSAHIMIFGRTQPPINLLQRDQTLCWRHDILEKQLQLFSSGSRFLSRKLGHGRQGQASQAGPDSAKKRGPAY